MASESAPLNRLQHDAKNQSITSPPSSTWKQCVKGFVETNAFVLKAALAIGVAKLYPPLGDEYVHPEITATWIAVIFIFFMAGLSLKSSEFSRTAAGLLWFNAFVLTYNFVFVSLIVVCVTKFVRQFDLLTEGLTNGMVICSCMPVTVTMVIVLTKSAQGSEVASVMLAATGCLLSVVVTPALLLLYIGAQSDVPLSEVFFTLVLRVVLPLLFGQLVRWLTPPLVQFITDHKKQFKEMQENALIFIIYTVFCKTFRHPIEASVWDVVWMSLLQGTTLIVVMVLAWYLLNLFFRDEPRLQVTGLYGCTQKSVAVGIPMISALYQHDPRAGIFTLPLLIWHPLQLLIGAALAPHLAARVERIEEDNENVGIA